MALQYDDDERKSEPETPPKEHRGALYRRTFYSTVEVITDPQNTRTAASLPVSAGKDFSVLTTAVMTTKAIGALPTSFVLRRSSQTPEDGHRIVCRWYICMLCVHLLSS